MALLLVFTTAGLKAAPFCAPRDTFANVLKKLKEARKGRGVTNRGIVELYVAPNGGWSIVYTNPAGVSCGISTGTDWEEISEKLDLRQH